MKNTLNILLLFLSINLFSQGIKFQENPNFASILEKAKKEKKIIFIDAFASWCGPCKMMTKNIFPLPKVGDFYNKNFINLAIDMEKGEGRTIAQQYGVTSYPTYLFIDGNGALVQKDLGYMEEEKFIELGKETLNTQKFGSLKERFEKGESTPEFLEKVIQQYYQSDYPLAKLASEKYFSIKKTPISEKEIGLLFTFIKSTKDKNYEYLTQHKSEILQWVPENSLDSFLKPILLNEILEQVYSTGSKSFNYPLFISKASPIFGESEATKIAQQLLLQNHLDLQNFTEYEKLALELYKNPDDISEKELSLAARVFADHVKNPMALKTAQIWAEKSVMTNESADTTYTLAKLLFLNGKKEMAKDYAKLSKILAEKYNQNTEKIDELIKTIQ